MPLPKDLPMQKPSSIIGKKYNKWKIFRVDLPALLSKSLDEKLPPLLNKALDEKLHVILNKALDEKLPPLFNKALDEKLPALVYKALDEKLPPLVYKALEEKLPPILSKALEEKQPAHPMHFEGKFEPDNGAKVPERVEESPDKYNKVADNKYDAESQVQDKSHVSWDLL